MRTARPARAPRPLSLPLSAPRAACAAIALGAALIAGACSSDRGRTITSDIALGEFGRAAGRLETRMTTDRASRDYMLDRMRLLFLRLADGRTIRTDAVATTVFDLLRTQGINDDKTVAATVLGEGGVIFWKGEPFEQAMAYAAISVHKGVAGEWDNARAAALSSLFLLKDFGENERGQRKNTVDIARDAAEADQEAQRRADGSQAQPSDYIDKGYTPAKTNFALGYFLAGVANAAMFQEGGDPARDDESRDHFREALLLRPQLQPVADAIVQRRANTVIVVDFGAGPEKVAYGPDNALARFVPSTRSDERPLRVRQGNHDAGAVPVLGDVNRLAADHMWNNMEDVRQAKSTLGTLLLAGGGITAVSSDNSLAQIIGASVAGIGLLMKATASADTRYCEALPQRTYIVALRIEQPDTPVRLSIDDAGVMGLTLPALDPPPPGKAMTMHYVRMPHSSARRAWQWPGELVYANDASDQRVPGDDLPYILGGTCVRTPSLETLRRYQSAGNLLDLSLTDLENLYRDEGIIFDTRGVIGRDAAHILEGGRSMELPAPGSAGFARVFCQPHKPYEPRSAPVAQLAQQVRSMRAPAPLPPRTHVTTPDLNAPAPRQATTGASALAGVSP
jgi:hypothetical protein